MSGVKLAMVASICAKPYNYKLDKWVRTIATPPPTSITTIAAITTTPTPKCTTALNSRPENIPATWTFARRLRPCAPLVPFSELGFRGQKVFCSTSSSEEEEKDSNKQGQVSGGGLVNDMAPEKEENNRWCDVDDSPHNHYQHQSPAPDQHHHHQQSAKLLTLPTILTIGRVVAVPILICTFYVDGRWGTTATTSLFIVAAITDWLDGYIARKMRLGSAFGAFLDPVADKLMVAATLVLLCTKPFEAAMFGEVPWLLTVPSIAIIGREITMSAVREWAASQNGKLSQAVAVNNLGKWKTATQMIALTILLATRDSSLSGAGILVASGVVLLYASAGLAIWSLVVYMKKIWKVLLK